ncbi:hypothetical protein BVRB_8g201370 [Beta vulgaris subsp. vulgaris]|uniref:Uncharacterized protein n=1 Tax=Beta vulgaris subsp. vulgaris TaxID=3555 RepID=A0A0J8B9S4_BETVV|nr:uncharacterized protein LOC104883003 [Beta vulgaris subsp. vulgaris]KMS96607.1 hypothetical protein BVRB_8g201370 [Beta vulgaris subsp. vulgaris]
MKKLYKKGQVHPSPSPSPSPSSSSPEFSLSYLPAAILTLAASLSSQDKEVLAYLLSCSSTTPFDFDPSKSSSKKHLKNSNNNNNQQHPPCFSCYCFTCYTNFWARWDSSPNRQLIHEIIDAFEDNLLSQRKKKQGLSRRGKRKNNNKENTCIKGSFDNINITTTNNNNININVNNIDIISCIMNDDDVHGSDGSVRVNTELGRVDSVEEDEDDDDDDVGDETGEKQGSSVRKIVSFIGERIWGSVWG